MLNSSNIIEKLQSLEHLPLDNYRIEADALTEIAKDHLLEKPSLSGLLVVENGQVIGSITRRTFFEKLSKEITLALYSRRPIKLLLNNIEEEVLKVPASTLIVDAVKLSFSRPAESLYDPIVVIKNEEEAGMIDFSKLIISQSEIFSAMNQVLTTQESDLREYAERLEEQGKSVQEYARQLEAQQLELQLRNSLLEEQKAELQSKTDELSAKTAELSAKTEEIGGLNRRFEEVGILLSKEGEKTFAALSRGVASVIKFTEEINDIGNNFREKLTIIDQGNNLINKISKRVENLSFQASIIGSSMPVTDPNRIPFNMIIEEIEKLSTQIAEANTTINEISKELRAPIGVLVKTAEDNQSVVTNLSKDSQKTESALRTLSEMVQK